MPCYGLVACDESGAAAVTLERSNVEVIVHGFVANLSIELSYRNKSDAIVEVVYICPVDAKSAVYSFEAELEGRAIVAHCVEKTKAKEIYEKAVSQGHAAILGSEDELSGDLIHLLLGNLSQGETAELKLKMVVELPVKVDGAVTFTLPTVFNPRYCPADETSGPIFPQSSLEHKVFPSKTPYSLYVKGKVSGNFQIAKIISPSDPIQIQIDDEGTSATITQDGATNFDHDWSFKIYYQTVHKPHCLQMSGDKTNKGLMKDDIIMLNLFPEVPLEGFSPHNEIIFVVDRSGSMQGNKIEKAKTTLLLFLKSLPVGCRFNIISFGSSFEPLFESSSERYTENTLEEALNLQKAMDADMGGTEIFQALKHVYSMNPVPGYPRQIIVLTDGEVWNLEQIFNLISRHVEETRVFSVGIGDGASTALVQGIAEAGRGRYEMVVNEDQLQTKVMGLIASMLQEHVSDLKIECEVNPPQKPSLIPKVPPLVFGGQHLILYTKIKPNSQVTSVKASWKIGETVITSEISAKDCKIVHDSNFSFQRLAAKAQLKQWQMNEEENSREEIIDLSISSCVMSKFTAFVGIEQDKKSDKQKFYGKSGLIGTSSITPVYKCRPIILQADCRLLRRKSVERSRGPAAPVPCSLSGAQPANSVFNASSNTLAFTSLKHQLPTPPDFGYACSFGSSSAAKSFRKSKRKRSVAESASHSMSFDGHEDAESSPQYTDEDIKSILNVSDSLIDIISSQEFNGAWDPKKCLKLINISEEAIQEIKKELSMKDDCFGTVLMLAILEAKFSSREQEWKLVAMKARMFLQAEKIDITSALKLCSSKLQSLIN